MTITVDLPMDTGELLEKALDNARDDEVLSTPDAADTSWSMRQADAFVNMLNGCPNGRFLHCHHVQHWSQNGETSLENLMLLCTKHHALVHEGGFRIEKDFQDQWIFIRPDGIAVPEAGYHSRDVIDMYDPPPAGGLLSIMEKQVSEPPAPVYLH